MLGPFKERTSNCCLWCPTFMDLFAGFKALPVVRFETERLLAVIVDSQALASAAYFQTSCCCWSWQSGLVEGWTCSSLNIGVNDGWLKDHTLLQLLFVQQQQQLPHSQGQDPRWSPTPPVEVHVQMQTAVVGLVFVCADDISAEIINPPTSCEYSTNIQSSWYKWS